VLLDRFWTKTHLLFLSSTFDLSLYLDAAIVALHSFGFKAIIQLENTDGTIKSAFLKANTSQLPFLHTLYLSFLQHLLYM